MNFEYNKSGRHGTGGKNGRNGYVTSAREDGEGLAPYIAVIAAIFLLCAICCAFFVIVGGNNTHTTTTAPDIRPVEKPIDPTKDYPYATVTDREQFVATSGGRAMYSLGLSSEYAILIRLSDMTTVSYKLPDTQMYPASMTKIMTVLTALDLIYDLDDGYYITRDILDTVPDGASTAYLAEFVGRTVSVRDLLYGITYRSGADAVLCLIDYLNLTVGEFAYLMNAKAQDIGMENTHFGGAIGMDDEENSSTCRDIAALMTYAMENPLCRELFGGEAYSLDYASMKYYNSTLSTTLGGMGLTPTTVLGSDYTLLAAKSGYESKAGCCLASYIKNNRTGEVFVLVTARAASKNDTIRDMQRIFAEFAP